MADVNGVCNMVESEVELILADNTERSDGSRELILAVERIAENNVWFEDVSEDVNFGEFSDKVNHTCVGNTALDELQAVADVVNEAEAIAVLHHFVLLAYCTEDVLRAVEFVGVGNHVGNTASVSEVDGFFIHRVVELCFGEGIVNSGAVKGCSDVCPRGNARKGNDVCHKVSPCCFGLLFVV